MNVLSDLVQDSLVAVTRKNHGLGNRVRVVLGARSLARWDRRRFYFVWPTGKSFGARFDDLWAVDDRVLRPAAARLLSAHFPFHDEKLDYLGSARRPSVVLIRTPHALHLPENATTWEQELQALRPLPNLGGRVRSFFDAHLSGEPYIGVMVRGHVNSHLATLRASPLDWYLTRMREIRQTRPGVKFFVSADTESAAEYISSEIGGCLSLREKGAYNSKQALRSSVVDLYLLASAGHILSPHYSSFPELARSLAGSTLRLETSQSGDATRLEPEDGLSIASDPTRPALRS